MQSSVLDNAFQMELLYVKMAKVSALVHYTAL